MSRSLDSYLKNYSEPETKVPGFPLQCRYNYALVVPAFAENIQCLSNLMDNINNRVLLILIANCPSEDTKATQAFTTKLLRELPCVWSNQQLSLLEYEPHKSILLVDRSTEGHTIPIKQGVGLARKIGFDLAVKLIAQGVVESPWINTTDADVRLPTGYPNHNNGSATHAAARLYPFHHVASPELSQACHLYDFTLQYYLQGLKYSGSPYAYHSVGSTMCIHYESYAKVRGFPKRAAGEDFYMLNKLAKVGDIESLDSPVLEVQARLSDRVPFGTGHALQTILSLGEPMDDYLYYNPEIFPLLRIWLEAIPEIWPNRHRIDLALIMQGAGKSQEILMDCLAELGALKAIQAGLDQYRSTDTFQRYIHQWFDAFRTLKFIHLMRERHFQSVPIAAVTCAPFYANIDIRLREKLQASGLEAVIF